MIIVAEIAFLTHAFRVGLFVGMNTLSGEIGSSLSVVTEVTHTLCVMSLVGMRTLGDLPLLAHPLLFRFLKKVQSVG